VKVQALIALKADFPLPVLLRVSGLARSTFFYHQARLQAPDPQEELKSSIMDIFKKNHGRYGHRRVHRELLNQGWTIAKKTVLMTVSSISGPTATVIHGPRIRRRSNPASSGVPHYRPSLHVG
jgi:putative transposase